MTSTPWSYNIVHDEKGGLESLTIFRHKEPYRTYHARPGANSAYNIRHIMVRLFDLASHVSQELSVEYPEQMSYFLTIISEITYKLDGFIATRCGNEQVK